MPVLGNRLSGSLLLAEGWLDGTVAWDGDGIITALEGNPCAAPITGQPKVLPGFVDLHAHGGAGADAMMGEDAVRAMARFHATQGTVALAPTTMTGPPDEIAAALDGIELVRVGPQPGEAQVLGAHLEGPFLNPARLGAQPPFTILPDLGLLTGWLGRARLVVATIAPEMAGGMDLLAQLAAAGTKVQIGHSDATVSEAYAALQGGASGFTHLYNAMSPASHRKPGVVGCALAWGAHAELICDLEHVAEAAVRMAVRSIPHVYAITDATAATGLPDGEYSLGRQTVVKRGSTCRTNDGALAGSALTMWECRENLLGIGFSEHLVQAMVASRPAAYLGLPDLGVLEVGRSASLVRVSAGRLDAVWVRGRLVSQGMAQDEGC